MKEKVGLIALGSRDDFDKWDDVVSLLAPEIEVETAGVLDGLTEEEIAEQFAFMPGETGPFWFCAPVILTALQSKDTCFCCRKI